MYVVTRNHDASGTPNPRSEDPENSGPDPSRLLLLRGGFSPRPREEVPEFLDPGSFVVWTLTK